MFSGVYVYFLLVVNGMYFCFFGYFYLLFLFEFYLGFFMMDGVMGYVQFLLLFYFGFMEFLVSGFDVFFIFVVEVKVVEVVVSVYYNLGNFYNVYMFMSQLLLFFYYLLEDKKIQQVFLFFCFLFLFLYFIFFIGVVLGLGEGVFCFFFRFDYK